MNFPLFSTFRSLAVLTSILGTAHAQSPSVSIRLLAFSRVGDAREVIVAGPDGKPLDKTPLALPTQQLSPPLAVGSRSLVFRASLPAVTASGTAESSSGTTAVSATGQPEAPASPLGKVELPATGNEFILIFLPDAKDAKMPYRVDAVPVPAGGFGSGDHVFANYSGANIGFKIGEERVAVAAGKSAVFHPKEAGGNLSMIGYWQKTDGAWDPSPFYSSRLIIQKGVRNLILIVRDPKTGIPDFRGISDFVDAP